MGWRRRYVQDATFTYHPFTLVNLASQISFVDLVLSLYRQGKTVKGYLDELYERCVR